MLDAATKSCPDLYGMMKAFDINWRNVNGGKKWFISKLVHALIEMLDNGNIVEKFYDNHNFPINTDKKGNKYVLNSEKDHLCRTKVLYHPKIISDKKEVIKQTFDGI